MLAQFKPYAPEEAGKIFAERAQKAFEPRTAPKAMLSETVEAASKAGDIRVGFSILLTTRHLAERNGRGKVGLDDFETAAKAVELTSSSSVAGTHTPTPLFLTLARGRENIQ